MCLKRRKFSHEFKAMLINQATSPEKIRELACTYNVQTSQIYNWRQEYEAKVRMAELQQDLLNEGCNLTQANTPSDKLEKRIAELENHNKELVCKVIELADLLKQLVSLDMPTVPRIKSGVNPCLKVS